MSTAPHPVAPEEIMAHLDGELSAERAPSVATHVEACADCKEVRRALECVSVTLQLERRPRACQPQFRGPRGIPCKGEFTGVDEE
jgi:anti-sigma factor RsiW